MHQFLSSISLRLGSPPCSLLSSCTTLTSTLSVYISAPSARYVCILALFPGQPGNEANMYMHHTWTGKRFVTFWQIVIKMATKSHYVYNKSRYKWFLCIDSWLLCVFYCRETAVRRLAFSWCRPSLLSSLPPLGEVSLVSLHSSSWACPNFKSEANLPEFRVPSR